MHKCEPLCYDEELCLFQHFLLVSFCVTSICSKFDTQLFEGSCERSGLTSNSLKKKKGRFGCYQKKEAVCFY